MPFWAQLSLQEPSSYTIESLDYFHDVAIVVLTLVLMTVWLSRTYLLSSSYPTSTNLRSNRVETLWTLWPSFILITLGLPSLRILYLMDESTVPYLTFRVVGHQWYWSYSAPEIRTTIWDSYIVEQDSSLLEVDNRLLLPVGLPIRILVTSSDVLHAWSVSSAGLKVDATPGRLRMLNPLFNKTGVLYGQCSELCGANHSFMPIVAEVWRLSRYRGLSARYRRSEY